MKRVWRGGLALLVALASISVAGADGLLPSQPYHYLHPPPALARENRAPSSITRSFPLKKGRLATDFILFTPDSQAGLGGNPGQITAPAPAKTIRLSIRPVNPPGKLPSTVLLDGNAYNIQLEGEPGNKTVSIRHTLPLAMRWPHGPSAVLLYFRGKWRTVCSPFHWQISPPNIVVCQVKQVGIFAVVHRRVR